MTIKFTRASYADYLADDPLREFNVEWLGIQQSDVDSFAAHLQKAKREQDLQSYLESHPTLLIQQLAGGHGRWVIPQKRLGSDYVTDFMIGEKSSLGFEWIAVELESPEATLFNKNGDPSRTLNHAIRQITDWRSWLLNNQNYASRDRSENGLGLTDIDPHVKGLILIGRRSISDPNTKGRRCQMSKQSNIAIHTYDWLLETISSRVLKQ